MAAKSLDALLDVLVESSDVQSSATIAAIASQNKTDLPEWARSSDDGLEGSHKNKTVEAYSRTLLQVY
jgi:hypothetical protein